MELWELVENWSGWSGWRGCERERDDGGVDCVLHRENVLAFEEALDFFFKGTSIGTGDWGEGAVGDSSVVEHLFL